MLRLVREAGLGARIAIDSAGTGAYHVGELADSRSRAEALRRGVELQSRARQFVKVDLTSFDYVIAMDRQNVRDLHRHCGSAEERDKVRLLRSFDPASTNELDVPDPYHDGEKGFVHVYDICEAGCRGLLAHLRATHAL